MLVFWEESLNIPAEAKSYHASEVLPQVSSATFKAESTRVLSLESFPPIIFRKDTDASSFIAAYLSRLITEAATGESCCFLIPSLSSLAVFFRVSPQEIRKAFRQLRREGHQYIFPGLYGHITLWAGPPVPVQARMTALQKQTCNSPLPKIPVKTA